jgi:hypothetical protein
VGACGAQEIIQVAQGVIISRGNLGMDVPIEKVARRASTRATAAAPTGAYFILCMHAPAMEEVLLIYFTSILLVISYKL